MSSRCTVPLQAHFGDNATQETQLLVSKQLGAFGVFGSLPLRPWRLSLGCVLQRSLGTMYLQQHNPTHTLVFRQRQCVHVHIVMDKS